MSDILLKKKKKRSLGALPPSLLTFCPLLTFTHLKTCNSITCQKLLISSESLIENALILLLTCFIALFFIT